MAGQRQNTKSIMDEPTCFCCFPLLGGCITLGYVNLIYTVFQTYTRFNTLAHSEISMSYYKLYFMISVVILNGIWICINIACLTHLHMRNRAPVCLYIFFIVLDRALYVADGVTYIMMVTRVTDNLLVFRSLDLVLPIQFMIYLYKCMKYLASDWEDERAPKPVTNETVESITLTSNETVARTMPATHETVARTMPALNETVTKTVPVTHETVAKTIPNLTDTAEKTIL